MADLPIRVARVLATDEQCELRAEDCRAETYCLELDCKNGMTVEVILCRHHVRTLHHVLIDV